MTRQEARRLVRLLRRRIRDGVRAKPSIHAIESFVRRDANSRIGNQEERTKWPAK